MSIADVEYVCELEATVQKWTVRATLIVADFSREPWDF